MLTHVSSNQQPGRMLCGEADHTTNVIEAKQTFTHFPVCFVKLMENLKKKNLWKTGFFMTANSH